MSASDLFRTFAADAAAACSVLVLSVGPSLAQIIEGGSRLLSHGGVHDDLRAACVSACSGANAQAASRFRDKLLPIWERHGIRPIGFWTTLVGESSNELTYILQWESLADREMRWTAFQNDPAWHKVRDDSERDGPIVASINNQILTPTPFSALK